MNEALVKWMQSSFGHDVNAASDYIWVTLREVASPAMIWDMLVEKGGNEITPDVVREVAEEILHMELDSDGDFGDNV